MTKADVLRVAKKYIDIDRLAIVIVGDRASIEGAAQGDQHRADRLPRHRGRAEDAVDARPRTMTPTTTGLDDERASSSSRRRSRRAMPTPCGQSSTAIPELKAALDEPMPGAPFDQPALLIAVGRGNRAMIDALLERRRGHQRPQPLVGRRLRRARQRRPGSGAVPARAWRDRRRARGRAAGHARRARDAPVRHARRSCTPAAATGRRRCTSRRPSTIAQLLLDRGADIDARDVDHESTPAQYMVRRSSGGRALSRRPRLPHRHPDGCRARRSRPRAAAPRRRSGVHPHAGVGGVLPEAGPAERRHHLHVDARRRQDRARRRARVRSR